MTTEMTYLIATTGLLFVLVLLQAMGGIFTNGIAWAAGNRHQPGETSPFAGRLLRASANMKENLPLFAVLVLVLHGTQTATATTAFGAQLFFFARVAHAALYIAGVAWIRTLAWVVSLIGLGLLASGLF